MKITQRLVYIGANTILAYCRAKTSFLNASPELLTARYLSQNHTFSPQEYSNNLNSNLSPQFPIPKHKVPSSLPLKRRKEISEQASQKLQQPPKD